MFVEINDLTQQCYIMLIYITYDDLPYVTKHLRTVHEVVI